MRETFLQGIKSSRSENIFNKMKSSEYKKSRDIERNCYNNNIANTSSIPIDIYCKKYIKAAKLISKMKESSK